MPITEMLQYLRVLDVPSSWRAFDLPSEITRNVLIELDRYGFINVRLWGRGEDAGDIAVSSPRTRYGRNGWFLARDNSSIGGTLESILNSPLYQDENAPEFELSESAFDYLRDAALKESGKERGRDAMMDSTMSGEALALAVLVDHPDWTDGRIAKAARVSRTALYRFPKFKAAREKLRDGMPLKSDRRRGRTGNRLRDTLRDTERDTSDD